MSEQKRIDLLALARRYGAVILEDDHSSELRFKGAFVPSIRALGEADDLILYARGFGKVFMPGLRLGYLIVPDAFRHKLLGPKPMPICIRIISCRKLSHIISHSVLCSVSRSHAKELRTPAGAIVQKPMAGMPEGTLIDQPDGGLSLWLTLPEGADVSELYFRAVRRGVAFVSGDVFHASRSGSRSLRVSFGLNRSEELTRGVERCARWSKTC